MLLNGATLLSEPCPYCSGVRVMKEGYALCSSCGREPQNKEGSQDKTSKSSLEKTLEVKIEILSKELEQEVDYEKQQSILKSINALLETLEKIRKKQ